MASRKKRPIMVQGTTSNAGKSVLAAALCRILLQDGFRVAPFKAQNMSLNSFVTPDGCEIGRAQATQAAACRLEPDARMNPVLLKPTGDVGSQVIVMGKPVANMRVGEYVAYKPTAFEAVKKAYDELAHEFDVVVLEGAGSPAEINLKAHDIVNMAMARYADAAVLLAVDIDRGGAFAQLVGTWELLETWERDLLAGFILNRFRGDASLLGPALEETTRRTGRPFFGTIPFVEDLGLPEEDSVSFKELLPGHSDADADIDIVVIDLPRISNFTDLDALRAEPDVRVRIARRPDDLFAGAMPDAIIIPGSKNTVSDLAAMRSSGMADAIVDLARSENGPAIVGICGGFQILGKSIEDPGGVDGAGGSTKGLGLLDVATNMGDEKILMRASATHVESGLSVTGYEIHHGVTSSCARPAFVREDGVPIGYAAADGRVWGGYLHGVFDAGPFRRYFVNALRAAKGLDQVKKPAMFGLDSALDRVADVVRAHLDMDAVHVLLDS